jgi:hypothetical protein
VESRNGEKTIELHEFCDFLEKLPSKTSVSFPYACKVRGTGRLLSKGCSSRVLIYQHVINDIDITEQLWEMK